MNKYLNEWPNTPVSGAGAATLVGPVGTDQAEGIPTLLKYWRVAIRWKWVMAGILAASIAAGLVITLLMTPKYTATSTIEISRQQEKIVQVQDVAPEASIADEEFYQTQYSLLQARSLAESVARDLKLADDNSFFEVFGIDPDEDGIFSLKEEGRMTPERRAKREKVAVKALLDNIGINPIRQSRLVNVTFTSPDAALSQRVTNAWTSHFIDSNLNRRFESTSYARKFLEGRLEQLRRRLEESERVAVGYASNQKIISVSSSDATGEGRRERSLVAEDLEALNAELTKATADRIKAQSRDAQRGGSSTEALTNVGISTLRQKRAELAAEYARLMTQFEPTYPPAAALKSQIEQFDRGITREEARVRQNLTGSYAEASARENALRQKVEGLKTDLLDLRRRSIQYNIYQREVDTNRQLYDGLLQRYKEIGIAGGVGTNNVSIVDPAPLPDRPSSPRLLLNMLLAVLAGGALAAGAALALEQIDEAVKDPSDVKDSIGLPVLGTIPKSDRDEPVALLLDRKSAMAEAYLSVQTNLQFTTDHGMPRSLAVTSTRSGEGKSTTSFAIALSLARTQRKVILVDCDMRSPSVHQILGIGNDVGTSNFLSGDDGLDSMIKPVERLGLATLVAGPLPPNAAELLTSPRLAMLIKRLLETFDHVVIDSPPVLGLADAPLIASRTEGVIYAIEAQGVRASMIRTAIARLDTVSINLLGAVLTKFEAKKAHYGYGYDYGYGYGQPDTKAA